MNFILIFSVIKHTHTNSVIQIVFAIIFLILLHTSIYALIQLYLLILFKTLLPSILTKLTQIFLKKNKMNLFITSAKMKHSTKYHFIITHFILILYLKALSPNLQFKLSKTLISLTNWHHILSSICYSKSMNYVMKNSGNHTV